MAAQEPDDQTGKCAMDRRKFVSLSGAGAAGLLADDGVQPAAAQTRPASGSLPPLKVRLGHELGHLDDKILMPDHAPRVPGNPGARNENFAFEFGYIRGLIQAEQHIT